MGGINLSFILQEKLQLEKELSILRSRLEKDFVSRYELEQLRNSYEVALSRAKYEAEVAARDDLNEKLCQINTFIEKQVCLLAIPLPFVCDMFKLKF
jgi:uncharacterized protein YfaA (DUF2138 family)